MERDDFLQNHWEYYLMLEDDFCKTNRYVELCEDNYETFSKEFYMQLIVICMEVESVMIEMSERSLSSYPKINEFGPAVEEAVLNIQQPNLQQIEVTVKNRSLKIKPFENWDTKKAKQSLFWWLYYNNAKHNRLGNEKKANLKTVLYALAGLYILEKMRLKQIVKDNESIPDIPFPESKLFSVYGIKDRYRWLGDACIG